MIRLITGLYEDVHGLVSEQFFDPKINSIFQSSENMTNQWWPFRTIWSVNEQRADARSGVIGWPQHQIVATKYEPYRKDRSFKDIADQMLRWFNDPKEPINFGAIYYPEPELTG